MKTEGLTSNEKHHTHPEIKWNDFTFTVNQSCNCSTCRHLQLKLIQKKQLMIQHLHKAQQTLNKSVRPLPPFWQALKHPQFLHNWQQVSASAHGIGQELVWSQFPQCQYIPQHWLFQSSDIFPMHHATCLHGWGRLSLFCRKRISTLLSSHKAHHQTTIASVFQLSTRSFSIKRTSLQHNQLKLPYAKN